jgi:hypothetical protein
MRRTDQQGTPFRGGWPANRFRASPPVDPVGWAEPPVSALYANDAAEESDWESAWIDLGGEG